jgi:hypothetical protein
MMIAAETEMFKLSEKPNIDFKKTIGVAKFHPSTINISLNKHNIITQPNPLFDIFIKNILQ